MADAVYQKIMRIGMLVKRAMKIHVNRPPPTWRAKYAGTRLNRQIRRALEKLSLQAASAGNGAFFMAGYCATTSQLDLGIPLSLCKSFTLTVVVLTP